MIELKDVTYQVGSQTILDQMNLKINKGERIALIGPSGAGKSSLLNLLSKRVEHTMGSINIENNHLKNFDQKKLSDTVGMITQSFDLIEAMSIRSNVYIGQFRNWSILETLNNMFRHKVDIQKILESVGLKGLENKGVKLLSGGEKQRVAIARLIMQNPEIILADEPIASLDPSLSGSMIELLLKTSKEKTLMVSLHQQDYAVKYFDRIIALKDGKIYFDLPVMEVTEEKLNLLYERQQWERENE